MLAASGCMGAFSRRRCRRLQRGAWRVDPRRIGRGLEGSGVGSSCRTRLLSAREGGNDQLFVDSDLYDLGPREEVLGREDEGELAVKEEFVFSAEGAGSVPHSSAGDSVIETIVRAGSAGAAVTLTGKTQPSVTWLRLRRRSWERRRIWLQGVRVRRRCRRWSKGLAVKVERDDGDYS